MERHYPTIRDGDVVAFEIVKAAIEADPEYLRHAREYSPRVLAFLEGVFGPKKAEKALSPPRTPLDEADALFQEGEKGVEALERELVGLYRSMQSYGEGLQFEDQAQKMAYYRTATTLLERILALHERAGGVKQASEFTAVVVRILERVLSDPQRTAVMEELRKVA